jgi:hypothetical protein
MQKLFCACAPKAVFERCELQPGLLARRCAACRGVLLALPDYRNWRDRHFSELPAVEPVPLPGREAPSRARVCPSCGHLDRKTNSGLKPRPPRRCEAWKPGAKAGVSIVAT